MQSKLCVRECRWSLILFKESTSPECVCRAYAGSALAPNVVSTPCAGPGPQECMREAETACATRMHTHTHPRNEHPLCLAVDAHAARRRRATPPAARPCNLPPPGTFDSGSLRQSYRTYIRGEEGHSENQSLSDN